MPVRLRITLLFGLLVTLILGIVCSGIYYFSYKARINTIKTRLTNRALTTARLLSSREVFDEGLVRRIDSLTTIALKNKTVQVYDSAGHIIYSYSDIPGDTIHTGGEVLKNALQNKRQFFTSAAKEAVAYPFTENKLHLVIIASGEDVEGKQNLLSLLHILLLSFLIGVLFILFSGYLFSARLLLPVRKITADVEEISAQNLTRRIETGKSGDEWSNLSATLNRLLNRLQESFEVQRRFISNASHELSTPLTSISSQLEVSLQRQRSAEAYKAVMQSIYQDVRQMSKLTQTLLQFAKASGNAGGLEISLVRIDEIVLALPSGVSKLNAQYSVTLHFEDLPENEESLLVYGNEALLFTAVKNIVINACKYSDDHQAAVSLQSAEKQITVIIKDKGKGIPEAELKTIFQPFYRVEENANKEGFGLGLSLADRIVKLHNGLIEVHSVPDEGTSFRIILPSARF